MSKPIMGAWLVWENKKRMRVLNIGPLAWLKKRKACMREGEDEQILEEGEIILNPDGEISLPDVFLESFSTLPDAYVVMQGMYGHIEIYKAEDYRLIEEEGKALFRELLQDQDLTDLLENKDRS